MRVPPAADDRPVRRAPVAHPARTTSTARGRGRCPGLLGALLLAGLLAGLLTGCGEGIGAGGGSGGSSGAAGSTTAQAAFQRVLDALGRHDYDALYAVLTPVGRAALENDLRAFCASVAHPQEGPRLMGLVRQRWPDVPNALVERVRKGDLRAAWDLFMTAANPPDVQPRQAGMKVDPGKPDESTLFYRYGDGPELAVVLRRAKGFWACDQVALGGR
ncbi:MAG: hypothetical protein ACKOSS_09270 [Planctomycetia bacterium]